MSNFFDQFDQQPQGGNPFDQFDDGAPKAQDGGASLGEFGKAIAGGINQGGRGLARFLARTAQAPRASLDEAVKGAAAGADSLLTKALNEFVPYRRWQESPDVQRSAQEATAVAEAARAENMDADNDSAAAWLNPRTAVTRIAKGLDLRMAEDSKKDAAIMAAETPNITKAAQAIQEADGFVGTGKAILENPSGMVPALAESLPAMALGVGAAGKIGQATLRRGAMEAERAAAKVAAAGGDATAQAAARAQVMAQVERAAVSRAANVGAGVEGVTAGSQSSMQLQDEVLAIPTEKLQAESPRYRELLAELGVPEAARQRLASEVGAKAGGLVALGTVAGSKLVSKAFGGDKTAKLLVGAQRAGVRDIPRNALQEGIEEVSQGVPQDLAEYGAASMADPNRELDLGGSAAQNLAAGIAMGGPSTAGKVAWDAATAAPKGVPAQDPGGATPPAGPGGSQSTPAPVAPVPKTQEPAQLAQLAQPANEAEKALFQPRELTALDRVQEIDTEIERAAARRQDLASPDYGPAFDGDRADADAKLQELQAEREKLAAGWPNMARGAPATFTTEAGARVDAEFALVDADELVTSHDTNLRQDPRYPQELQPRERDRAASEMQIGSIVQRLDPARLGASADAANGAPIVGADGLVESGNARTIALKRTYEANGGKAAEYRDWLRANAASFGLDPAAIDSVRQPVLVRLRRTPVDRAEFARQANASTVAQMSPSEQARSDAKRIDTMEDLQPDESGDFSGLASRPFVRRFLAKLPVTEQAGMIDSAGNLSTAGNARIRNAVLARAYGDSPVLQRMVESMDDNLRNVSKALIQAAPRVAAMRESVQAGARFDADITPALMEAVEELSRIKDSGRGVQDALAQTGLMGDQFTPDVREILGFLAENMRRPKKMADFIEAYMAALDEAGNPAQDGLFGAPEAPSTAALLDAAKRSVNADQASPAAAGAGQPQPAAAEAAGPGREAAGRPAPDAGAAGGGAESEREPGDPLSNARRAAIEDFKAAAADLGDMLTRQTRATMVPENTPGLMPTLVKLSGAAIRLVGTDAVRVSRWVQQQLKKQGGELGKLWNRIAPETYRKAALQALDGMSQQQGQAGLFDSPEAASDALQDDLFAAAAAAVPGTAEDDGTVGLRIANRLAADWQKALGDKVKVVMGGSLISGTFVQTGSDPIDMDVRFLAEDPESAIADVERVTGLKLRKTIQASDFPLGASTAFMIEGFLEIDGKTIEVEGNLRSPRYVGWANFYRKVFSEQELADFRRDKLALKGDKKAYKARKNAMLAEAQVRAISRGLVPEIPYSEPEAWKQADGKLVDEHGFERGAGLSSAERFAEQQFYDWLRADMDAAVKDYLAKFPAVVDADLAKEMSPLYRADAAMANAVHEPSSLLSKRAWAAALAAYPGDTVMVTAGGAGSGKSFAGSLARTKIGLPDDVLTFDSALTSPGAADARIREAREAGKRVVVVYTNTDAETAFGWSLTRPRLMKAETVASSHARAAQNIKRLAKLHDGSEDVRVFIVNNPGEQSLTNIGNVSDVPDNDYNALERKFREIARKAHDAGRLGKRAFEFVAGPEALDHPAPREGEGVVRGGDGRGQGASGRGEAARRMGEGAGVAGDAGTGGLTDADRQPGQGSDQGQGAQAARGTSGGRKAGRVREGSGQPDLFGGGQPDAAAADAGALGQAGADGVRGADEDGRVAGAGSRARRVAGVPAGRELPAKSGLNYSFGPDDLTYEGSWAKKAAQNVEAVELLKRLQAEGRQATREEQQVLAKFVGWGSSEIANTLFGKKLDTVREQQRDYEQALASMDALKRDYLRKGGQYRGDYSDSLYYTATNVLRTAGKLGTNEYPQQVTREQLQAAKPTPADLRYLELRDRLKNAMSPEEWAEAARSTQYAHYTSKAVVTSMWKAMERMGFAGGTVLEPGAGIGVFPGLMPQGMAAASLYTGIEFDSITGGILRQLFPDEQIRVESFVDTKLPRDFYDVAVGNPPFARWPVLADPEYAKRALSLHDYFFAKTIDRVKPGGLVVFVTSRYTMDKLDDKARQYLAERADLVSAIRLPQTAFKQNAGTEVVTDVLFLRKKVKGEKFEHAKDWLKTAEAKDAAGNTLMVKDKDGKERPALINEFFAANPDMVLGENANTGSMYSDQEYTVTPLPGDIETHFAKAVEKLPAGIYQSQRGSQAEAAKVREIDFNPKAKKEGNYYVTDAGVLMVRESGVGQRVELKSQAQAQLIKDFVPLRDALKQAHYDQLTEGSWEQSLAALQQAYKAFTDKHGQVNQFKTRTVNVKKVDEDTGEAYTDEEQRRSFPILDALKDDPDWTLVAALETVNDDTGEIKPSDFLTSRVLGKPVTPQVKSPVDALLTVLNDTGEVDMAAVAERAGVTEQEAIEALGSAVYRDPSQGWVMSDDYLSGNVKRKLDEARVAARTDRRFERNVAALEAVQPTPRSPSQINVAIGMNWIPGPYYQQFLWQIAKVRAVISWNARTKEWVVQEVSGGKSLEATATHGTDKRNVVELMEHALTGRKVLIKETDKKTKQTSVNEAATEAANEKLKQLRESFADWIWTDPARTDELVRLFNDKFNTTVARTFNGSHLTLPGSSKTFKIFDHVKRGAWRIIQKGNTYLAHAVGSGKTFQMVIAAMEQKRLGLIKKPMIVVPNHMLQQFASEWQQLYPAARLMVADETNFHTDNRRRFVSRVALSDLDGVIITHSAFKLLDLDPEFKQKMIDQQIEYLQAALEEAGGDKADKRDPKVKQIQRQLEAFEQKLEKLLSSAGKDANVRFDELGVDQVMVDEAHEFRKLDFATSRQVKGLSPQGSARAFDLYMKTRWLEEQNPGRSLVMASGTPITNTVAELYSVQKFMDPKALEERGIEDFDSWAAMFGRESVSLESTAAGTYEPVTRFNRFVNIPELTQMFREYADVLTADNLGELLGDKRPKVAGGSRKLVLAPKVPDYAAYQRELARRMEISREWKPSRDEPNNPDPIIRIIGDGRLAAIDMRFADPSLPSNPQSKLNRLIDGVISTFKATAEMEFQDKAEKTEPNKGATMMVFSDLGFGAGVTESRGFNARAWFEKRLRDAGIPPAQVAFMSDYKKSTDKLKLFKDVNQGRVRVLVGSSKNMGTGVNAQQRLKALFHLDSPWFPSDLEQREGRIIRQGNKNKEVEIYAYSTKGSYDEVMWRMLATKQVFIDAALSGDENVREIEDLSSQSEYETLSAMVAEDQRVLQLAGLNAEVAKLQRLYQAHEQTRAASRERYRNAVSTIDYLREQLPKAEAAAAKVEDLSGDKFRAKIGTRTVTERKAWAEALETVFKDWAGKQTQETRAVGSISGFDVVFNGSMRGGNYLASLDLVLPGGPVEIMLPGSPVAGVAMRAQNAVAEVAVWSVKMRERIAELAAQRDALESRISAPFPMAGMLAEKQKEAADLAAEIARGPEVTEQSITDDWVAATGAITPLFSRAAHDVGAGVKAHDLEAMAAVGRKAMPGLPPVVVLNRPSEAPEALRKFIEARGAMNDAEGALHDGKIYLFAAHLSDMDRAEHVLLQHEAGHAGLAALLGAGKRQAMQAIYNQNAAVRRQAEALRTANPKMSVAEATEEVLVDMPRGAMPKLAGWRLLVERVRDALQARGLTRIAGWLDRQLQGSLSQQQRADLFVANLMHDAREALRRPAADPTVDRSGAGTMLQSGKLADDIAAQEKWLNAEARARGFQDIEDLLAKNYPLFEKLAELWRKKNPADALLSRAVRAVTETPAFKRWFGDSKVVDASGKPLVVYHGTHSDVQAFTGDKVKSRFPNSEGFYFTSSPFHASVYADSINNAAEGFDPTSRFAKPAAEGGNVMPAYVSLQNPKLITVSEWGTLESSVDGDGGARVRAARAAGHDGVIVTRKAGDDYDGQLVIAFRPEQIKSAIGNDGSFDPAEADIRLSRATPQPSAQERAEAIIQQHVTRAAPLDRISRFMTQAFRIERMAGAIYDKAAFILDRYTPERIKAGVVSDYGVPEAVIDQRVLLQGRQRVQLRKAGTLIEKLSTLTRAESRVAYAWMNEADPELAARLMDELPADSVQVLGEVSMLIEKLSKEAIAMGQLSPEAYQRNRFAYLRRSYLKHVLPTDEKGQQRRQRAIAILGEQYKGRGLTEAAPMRQIQNTAPEWWQRKVKPGQADASLKGQKFIRLERRALQEGAGVAPLMEAEGPANPNAKSPKKAGRLREIHYYPAGEPLPAKYADWDQAGTWEVRTVKGGDAIMWRDFTKAEREKMGEIDEARFAIAKTLHGMIHDVEVGRYLEWMAHTQAVKPGAQVPGTVVEATERYRDTYAPGEWVQVPDTTIPGTNVARYGKLAGRYLPGPVWNDLRQVVSMQTGPLGEAYQTMLSAWKTAKTALSPAVHTNNIMSNFVMADWHDVGATHIAKALRILLAAQKGDGKGLIGTAGNKLQGAGIADREAAREILNRYQDSGGDIGGWVTAEISREQIDPLLQAIEAEARGEQPTLAAQLGVMAALQHALHLRWPDAWAAFKGGKVAGKAVQEGANLIDLYQSEDDVFRLAAWLKAKEEGKSDMDAGKAARTSFLDYRVNAPWIQAMRKTAWPFVSFSYRAIPMLLETAGKRPHKLMKLMAVAGALNALGALMAGGDDDEERKMLPEEKAGRIWGMVPKLIRMPWNDDHGSPVYLDIRRFVPVGDVFDVGAGQSAIPLLPALNPGGPLVIFGEVVFNKSAFTGKAITLETDTGGEQAGKLVDHLWKAFAPNILGLPGTYATTGVLESMQGKTDAFGREMSTAQALGNTIGVKLGSYPADVLRRNLGAKAAAEMAEIDTQIAQLKRQRLTNRLDDTEFREKVGEQQAKKLKIAQGLREKVQ